jgi:hypothetical protein
VAGASYHGAHGGAPQVETDRVECAKCQRLKLKYDQLLSSFAFDLN